MKARFASDILAIPIDEPERLFSNPHNASAEYHQLAKEWHPDRNKAGDAVFTHLTALWAVAKEKIRKGEWIYPGILTLNSQVSGLPAKFHYIRKEKFELGECYFGKTFLAYAVDPDYKDLYEVAKRTTREFRFPDTKMANELSKCLPGSERFLSESKNRHWIIWRKAEDLVKLRDVLEFCGGTVDPRHVAWIGSRLLNIACYLGVTKLAHQDISLDSVWICPEKHTAILYGGWWYAAPCGQRITSLPARSYRQTSPDVRTNKRADSRLDLNLIRLTLTELLGGTDSTPTPMAQWLRLASAGNALADYYSWYQVLEKCFGPRKFVPLNVSAAVIYAEPSM
jgi:hypothetical protein